MAHIRGILVSIILLLTFSSVAIMLWLRYTRRTAQIPAYLDSYWDALKERRKSIRFREQLPVTCSIAEKDGDIHRIFSKDISGEGICLRVPEMLPEGTQLDLKVEVPSGDTLPVKGEVVWVKEAQAESENSERFFDTGVRFTKITPRDKALLGAFLISVLQEKVNDRR